jgi:DNA-binding NtrC family response regulator
MQGRILLVDATSELERTLREIIDDRPFPLTKAQSMAEGMQHLLEGEVDIMVCGNTEHFGSWSQWIALAKEQNPRTLCIVVAQGDDAQRALEHDQVFGVLDGVHDVEVCRELLNIAIAFSILPRSRAGRS